MNHTLSIQIGKEKYNQHFPFVPAFFFVSWKLMGKQKKGFERKLP